MDKSWISMPSNSKEFRNAVLDFIEFALQDKKKILQKIKCPCKKCCSCNTLIPCDVYNHLVRDFTILHPQDLSLLSFSMTARLLYILLPIQFFYERTKHIDIDRHFVRDEIQQGIIHTIYAYYFSASTC
jgi:hypothetical protein